MKSFTKVLICLTLLTGLLLEGNLRAGDFSISGDVQYRLRYDVKDNKGALEQPNGPIGDFSNRYMWNLRAKKNVTENLTFGIRLSNPRGYFTDEVNQSSNFNNDTTAALDVPEFYFNYSEKRWSFSAGIIPVYSNVVLNVVAAEEFLGYQMKGLSHVGIFPWAVGKNNSQIGMKGSYSLANNKNISVNINAITATVSNNKFGGVKYTNALKNDRYRFMLSSPITFKQSKLSLSPIYHLKTGWNSGMDESNFSHTAGLDVGTSYFENIKPKLGFAYGTYDIYGTESLQASMNAYYLRAKATIQPGFGKIRGSASYGISTDDEIEESRNNSLTYFDMRYVIPVKDFSIAPRLRVWNRCNDSNSNGQLHIRPEILITAGF